MKGRGVKILARGTSKSNNLGIIEQPREKNEKNN